MGNEPKQPQRRYVRRVPVSLSAEHRNRGAIEPPSNIYETLHQPERSEMLDFSGVFPIISLEPLPGDEERLAEPPAKPARGIPRAPVVIDPRPPRPHRYYSPPRARSRNSARSRSQLLYQRYQLPERWPAELLRYLPRHRLEWLLQLWQQESPVWRGRVRRALWSRASLRWRGSAWKLLPVGMAVNLLLLLVVVMVMASQALPSTQAHQASSSCGWHTVAGSETLYSISASYHLSAATLAQANHLKSFGAIHTGQRLCIPLGAPTVSLVPPDALTAPNIIAVGSVAGSSQFIQFALPYAQSAHQQTGWPVSMILAQWALEHGWKVPGFTGYNWGNVGALAGVPSVASGGAWGAPAYFAYAPTPQDGVNYYVAVAGLSYYSAVAPAGRSGGPNAAARALGASPWDAAHYTAIGSPGSSLITIMQNFDLYKYDN